MPQKGRRTLHVIANDIRSRENVGAIFRTCEFLGVTKLWLTGYTPSFPDPKLAKVSLGAEQTLEWERRVDVQDVLRQLKGEGFCLLGLELDANAIDLAEYVASDAMAVLLGNEVLGIPPSLLKECDEIVMIPRQGKKESLNVAIATGIACWRLFT